MLIAWVWVYLLCAVAQWTYSASQFLTPRVMDLINKTGFLLYLSHWLVLQFFVLFCVWPSKTTWPLSGLIVLALSLSVLCAFGLVLVCERVPGLGHLFGLYGTHRRFSTNENETAVAESAEEEEESKDVAAVGRRKRRGTPFLRPQFTLQLSGDWGCGEQTLVPLLTGGVASVPVILVPPRGVSAGSRVLSESDRRTTW
uniref:Uncharacterized protein n=1 Tax=Chromera velia CCMP2878 TaxID=1169474 RepID=A0A0G4H1C5_9ALVE|eukprot:Cvel_24282.t1-p1 / transcript=Cvel_24282.t1 / gene=Cvel_24282 / organism=Chromera_velia_CCMP2878 / gene_product=hypothetical protein / transcript_product=hypothetical protein / location=Cvel_scaffold2605:12658-13251(-) / protein_length=198 / sequence_SO=supercontig / SO=protein_coding / is_pseudo=false